MNKTNKEGKCPIRVIPYSSKEDIPFCTVGTCTHIMLPNETECPCHSKEEKHLNDCPVGIGGWSAHAPRPACTCKKEEKKECIFCPSVGIEHIPGVCVPPIKDIPEEKFITMKPNDFKDMKLDIKIDVSPRIDYCGYCDAEHGYDCPKDTPVEQEGWDEFDVERLSKFLEEDQQLYQPIRSALSDYGMERLASKIDSLLKEELFCKPPSTKEIEFIRAEERKRIEVEVESLPFHFGGDQGGVYVNRKAVLNIINSGDRG